MDETLVRTAKWVRDSHLVGDMPLLMTPNERKETTILGCSKLQRHYLKKIDKERGTKIEMGYCRYLEDTKYKKENQLCQAQKKFEQNGLCSYIDPEIKRIRQSKFLNSQMASTDAGGVRKLTSNYRKNLTYDIRKQLIMKDSSKQSTVMRIDKVLLTNNNESILKKYQPRLTKINSCQSSIQDNNTLPRLS